MSNEISHINFINKISQPDIKLSNQYFIIFLTLKKDFAMVYKFSLADIDNIKYLNTQLSLLEQKIYDESLYLAQQAFTYRQKNLNDYELELSLTFYREIYNEELIRWEEGIPKRKLLKKKPNWYINNGKNYNVSSSC